MSTAETTVQSAECAAIATDLPEVDLIEDIALRHAVCEIWAEALAASNWKSLGDVPKNPETLPETRRLLEHSRSVALQALAVARVVRDVHKIGFDSDTLIAAALLHDVSKLVEYEPTADGAAKSRRGELIQHGVWGAFKAWEKGLPEDLVHNIIVHTNNSKHAPRTWEAILVHYVDYLDSDALLFAEGRPLLLKK